MTSLLADMTLRLFRGHHKKESRPIVGSILGIALAMIPLIVVLFLSDAMIRGITDRYIETGTFHIQMRPYESPRESEWLELESKLLQMEGIISVNREHGGMGLAYGSQGSQKAVSLRGISPDLYHGDSIFAQYLQILEGSFDLSQPGNAVIGRDTAQNLSLKTGDQIRILTGKTLSTGKYIPKISNFTVRGIFTTGYQDLDKMWVFIPVDKGLKILQDSESHSRMMIKTDAPYENLLHHIVKIRESLDGSRWGIYSWQSLSRSQQSNYQTTRMLLILVSSLIIIVAVMNISSSMIMLVMENEQEIGILKSMGMDNRFIEKQYVLGAGLAGGTGSFLGIVLGILIVLNFNSIIVSLEYVLNFFVATTASIRGIPGQAIELLSSEYYLENFSIAINPGLCILVFVLTTVLSMIAAFIPLKNIRSIHPLDILRRH